MANGLYEKGKEKFLAGDILWKASGGHNFSAALIDTGNYSVDLVNHEFFSSVTGTLFYNSSVFLTGTTNTNGVADANDWTWGTVPAGIQMEAMVIYRNTGDPATSPLIAYIDTATGLPVTPNGGTISFTVDSGSSKLFKL